MVGRRGSGEPVASWMRASVSGFFRRPAILPLVYDGLRMSMKSLNMERLRVPGGIGPLSGRHPARLRMSGICRWFFFVRGVSNFCCLSGDPFNHCKLTTFSPVIRSLSRRVQNSCSVSRDLLLLVVHYLPRSFAPGQNLAPK